MQLHFIVLMYTIYLGIPSLFALSRQYHTSTDVINDLTTKYVTVTHFVPQKWCHINGLSSWAIFLLGMCLLLLGCQGFPLILHPRMGWDFLRHAHAKIRTSFYAVLDSGTQ